MFHHNTTISNSVRLTQVTYQKELSVFFSAHCAYVRTPTPPEKSQNIRFLSNTDPDPLKNRKATKPDTNVGSSSAGQRNAI